MGNNVYGTSTPFHVSIKKNELVLFQLTWESFQECFELKMEDAEIGVPYGPILVNANSIHRGLCVCFIIRYMSIKEIKEERT